MSRTDKIMLAIAGGLFFYALLGNYVALPGYLRFLERGGTSEAGNTMDLAVVIGAVRTITWMYAFNLGALCLYWLCLRRLVPQRLWAGIAIGVVWLGVWSIPELPRPPAAFYVVLGSLILLAILVLADGVSRRRLPDRFLALTGALFLVMASWDVCGLGSVGRILHPALVVEPRSQVLLVAQTTKLMLAFVFGWGLLAASVMPVSRKSTAKLFRSS